MATNGKKIAWLAVTLGIAALVAFGVSSKEWIAETWYLHQLEHGEEVGEGDSAAASSFE